MDGRTTVEAFDGGSNWIAKSLAIRIDQFTRLDSSLCSNQISVLSQSDGRRARQYRRRGRLVQKRESHSLWSLDTARHRRRSANELDFHHDRTCLTAVHTTVLGLLFDRRLPSAPFRVLMVCGSGRLGLTIWPSHGSDDWKWTTDT